jgi:hypothetical protein
MTVLTSTYSTFSNLLYYHYHCSLTTTDENAIVPMDLWLRDCSPISPPYWYIPPGAVAQAYGACMDSYYAETYDLPSVTLHTTFLFKQ